MDTKWWPPIHRTIVLMNRYSVRADMERGARIIAPTPPVTLDIDLTAAENLAALRADTYWGSVLVGVRILGANHA